MNINQNNYESFFLLYVDGELSAAEKLSVEAFIEQNPNLGAELQTLKEMILLTDESQIVDKTALYRSEDLDENMQEAMLLHIDDELPEAARETLVKKINEELPLQASWEILQKTKLDTKDIVVFPNKKTLYRKEKTGTVVYARFTRWAVAAALIAAGFFAGVAIMNNRGNQQKDIATVTDQNKPGSIVPKVIEKNEQLPEDSKQLAAESTPAVEPSTKTGLPQVAGVASQNVNSSTARRETPATRTEEKRESIENNKSSQQVMVAASNEKLNIKKTDRQEVSTILASVAERPKPPVEIIDRNMTPTESSYAYSTIMEEPQPSDNHILFMDEETVARTKAGIFFKKLKRTVTRSTNIKTGNSLKIAGFEFAVK